MTEFTCTFKIGNTNIYVPEHKDHLVERFSWAVLQCVFYGILAGIAGILMIATARTSMTKWSIVATVLFIMWLVSMSWFGFESIIIRSRLLTIGGEYAPCNLLVSEESLT